MIVISLSIIDSVNHPPAYQIEVNLASSKAISILIALVGQPSFID